MKFITLLIIVVTFSSCYSIKSQDLKTFVIERETYESSNCYEFLVDSNNAKKIDNHLVVNLMSGNTIVLQDTLVEEESSDMILYELLGRIESTDEILIKKTFLTFSQHILVNVKTGNIIELLESVCFNKNGDFITSNYSITDQLGVHDIYVKEDGAYKRISEIKNDLILDSPKWTDNTKLVFRSIANQDKYYSISLDRLK